MNRLTLSVAFICITVCCATMGTCIEAAPFTQSPTQSQETDVTKKQSEQGAKKSADQIAGEKILKKLSEAEKNNRYDVIAKLMTRKAWDSFCSSKISEAVMLASSDFGGNQELDKVLKEYKIDAEMPDPHEMMDAIPSKKEMDERHSSMLKSLKSDAQRIECLKALDNAKSPPVMDDGGGFMQVISISPFDGEVVRSAVKGDSMTLIVKPNLPKMLAGGVMNGGGMQIPPDVEIIEEGAHADGADMPFETEGDCEIVMGGMGEMPPFQITFKKVSGNWKCGGIEMEMGETENSLRNHPTIESPDFIGTTVAGEPFELKKHRGKVVLLDFWGTWCKGCVAEFPKLKKLSGVLKDKDFVLVGVAQDSQSAVEEYVEENPLPWLNVVDSGKICSQFKVNVFPTTLIIDKNGKHVASNLRGQGLADQLAELLDLNAEEKKELLKALKHTGKRKTSGKEAIY